MFKANTACDCGQINSDIRSLRINLEKLQVMLFFVPVG